MTYPRTDLSLHSNGTESTDRLGGLFANVLMPGDLVTLSGPLGAGKSHLARAFIRTRLGDPDAEVPSPSYTLVNVYQTADVEIWHADLYRLSDTSELSEIGLEDALSDAVVLVEWAERWPDPRQRRLEIVLIPLNDDERQINVTALGSGWNSVLKFLEGFME